VAIRAAELEVKVGADTKEADDKLEGVSKALGSTAKAATAAFALAGAGVAVGLGAAVNAAAGFEQKLSGIGAVSGATAAEMDTISAKALQLGKDTSFSASEAAAGIEELIKGGLSIPDVLNGAADATLNLAAAGGVSLPEAATIAANALAQFNLKGEDMAHVADLIAGAANASALDVGQFKFSLQAAGAVAATVGFSFDDLAEAIAVMGKAGVTGSDAGTSLKTMMMQLQPQTKETRTLFNSLGLTTYNLEQGLAAMRAKGINPLTDDWPGLNVAMADYLGLSRSTADWTKKDADAFEKLMTQTGAMGSAFFDANGKVKSMSEVAEILHSKTKDMTEAQRLQTLQTLFGSDAVRAAAILAKEGAVGFESMAGAMGKVTAESVGVQRLNNLRGDFEQLKGSIETSAIVLGRLMLPAMRQMTQGATALVNGLIPMIEKMGPGIVVAVTATVERLSAFFGSLTKGASLAQAVNAAFGDMIPFGLNAALDVLDAVFNRVKATVIAVATAVSTDGLAGAWNLAAGALSAFAPTGERIGRLLTAIKDTLTPLVTTAFEFVTSMTMQQSAGASLGSQYMTLATTVNTVSAAVETVVNFFQQNTAAGAALSGIITGLAAAWSVATAASAAMSAALTVKAAALGGATAAQWLLNAALTANPIGLVVVALAALTAALIYAYQNSEEFRAVVDAAFQMVGKVVAVQIAQIQAAIRGFGDILTWAGRTADQWREVIAGVFDATARVIDTVTDTITQVMRAAWASVQQATQVAWTAIQTEIQTKLALAQGIIESITTVITAVFRVWYTVNRLLLQAFWDYFGKYITDTFDDVSELVKNTTEAIYNKINTEWTNVRTATTTAFTAIQTFLSTTWNNIKTSVIDPAMEGIKTAISLAWAAIELDTTTKWNAVKTLLTGIWDASSGIRYIISSAVDSAKTTLGEAWESIRSTAQTKWDAVKTLVNTTWTGTGGIKSTVETNSSSVKGTLETAFESIRSTAQTKWSATQTLITTAISEAKRIASMDQATLESNIKTSFEAIRANAVTAWNSIKNAIDISGAVGKVGEWLGTIHQHFTNAKSLIEGTVRSLTDNINGWFDGAKAKADSIRSTVESWKGQVEGWVKAIQDAWNRAKALVESFPVVGKTTAPAPSAPAPAAPPPAPSGGLKPRGAEDVMDLATAPASMRTGQSIVNYITINVPTVGIQDSYRLASDLAAAIKPFLDPLGATQVRVG
jgi:phage-related protein